MVLQFTLISAFVHHRPPRVVDVFLALCIILLCITHTILVSFLFLEICVCMTRMPSLK